MRTESWPALKSAVRKECRFIGRYSRSEARAVDLDAEVASAGSDARGKSEVGVALPAVAAVIVNDRAVLTG